MIEQAAKIAIGTVFYVALLWLAQRNPRAAGIMLTFPALNGIVLIMADPATLGDIAGAVVFMPVLNGVMWASYLAGVPHLVRRGVAISTASWLVLLGGAVVWIAIGTGITRNQWSVPPQMQWPYLLVVATAGVVLTRAGKHLAPASARAVPQGVRTLLVLHRWRIALFVGLLGAIAVVQHLRGSAALLGVLAGLPLIAVFGMHAIAADSTAPVAHRLAALEGMAGGVWLGPCVAIFFVAVVWRALALLAGMTSGAVYLAAGGVVLLAGWAISIAIIWGMTLVLARQKAIAPSGPASPERTP